MGLLVPLVEHVREHGRGTVLGGCGVVLSADTLVVPDLLFVSQERRHIFGETYIEGAPDLLAEVLSTASDRIDRVLKHRLYARYGVSHYWLAHPVEERVRAYELGQDGAYELVAEGHGSEAFSAPPFPDLTIQLADLWDDLSDGD
jgi:Uma2 family endonuclease